MNYSSSYQGIVVTTSSGGACRSLGVMLCSQRRAVDGAVVAAIKLGGRTRVATGDLVTDDQPREHATNGREGGADQHGRTEPAGECGRVQIGIPGQACNAGNHRNRQ